MVARGPNAYGTLYSLGTASSKGGHEMAATDTGGPAFTREQNELLTRVGPDTPMGKLFRQYWIPMMFPEELTPERPQKRVRLLGEDLVAFRTRGGNVGLVGEFCS